MKKAWLSILIIVVLAVIAYFVYSYRNVLIPSSSESAINQLEVQGNSDEVSDIENDLNTTFLKGLDSEVSDIEKEFESAGI